MAFDLKDLSEKDLKALITQAKKQQSALNKRKPVAQIRKKLVALAKAEGYTIAELFGGKGKAKAPAAKKAAKKAGTTRKVAPKYRNPANAKETWSGRGKQPRWLAEQVKKGKKPEDFLIRK
jgi:DNA-binding protein H-NS